MCPRPTTVPVLTTRCGGSPLTTTPPGRPPQPTQELRDNFKLRGYLVVTRALVDTEGDGGGDGKRPGKRKRPGEAGSSGERRGRELIFTKPEDEVFHECCEWSFTVPTQRVNEEARKDKLRPLRLCMFLKASKVAAIRRKIDAMASSHTAV